MQVRSTIIVLILAALGVAAMIMVRCDANLIGANVSAQTGRLLTPQQLPVDDLTRITIRRADAPALVFERTGAQWNQVEPFSHPMDPFSIRQIAIAASELQVMNRIDPAFFAGEQSLTGLSLQPPAAEVLYEWPNGKLALHLGRRGAAGRAYLRLADANDVYVVTPRLHERVLEMDPKEWRDRRIFHNVGIESSRIAWTRAGGIPGVTLVRDRRTWTMLEPARTRVDAEARDDYLQELGRASVSGFVMDQPTDLARFGLASPVATVTITTPRTAAAVQDESSAYETQQVHIGSRVSVSSRDRFGMIEGRPVVVRLSAAVIEALLRQPQALADLTGSGVMPADVKSIVIRNQQDEFRLERDLERWIAPDFGRMQVAAHRVENLLQQLTQLRASGVEFKPYPHELEVAIVILYGYDGRALDTVRIARDPDTGLWAMENGDNVLRIFPESLQPALTPAEFGLR